MEHDNFVFLDFQSSLPIEQNFKKSIPSTYILFKQIQNETQALKQIKEKCSQNNIYDKIRKTLQKKLGLGRIYRGISVNQQIKIKQMIQTCRQRKHMRSGNLSQLKGDPTRKRNFSAKQKVNRSQESRILTKQRPLSRRPRIQRPSSSKINHKHYKSQLIGQKFLRLNQKSNEQSINNKLKKHSHNRQYSQITKQNKNPVLKTNQQINIQGIALSSSYQRRKQPKNVQLQTKFRNILLNCDKQKEDIVCIGRKIEHFQYFCHKMSDKKSKIQKFCKQVDGIRSTFDDSYT